MPYYLIRRWYPHPKYDSALRFRRWRECLHHREWQDAKGSPSHLMAAYRANGTNSHTTHVLASIGVTIQKRMTNRHDIRPPNLIRVLFGPTGLRNIHCMFGNVRSQHATVRFYHPPGYLYVPTSMPRSN